MKYDIDSIKQTIQSNKKTATVIGLVLLTALIVFLLVSNQPKAKTRPSRESVVSVEVVTAKKQNYPIMVTASGSVQAATRSNLVAQVRGEITYVSPKFNNGGFFNKGDTLLRIDNREYIANVKNAEANFLQAQSAYSQEQVNAEQAEKDWQRLGFDDEPNDLVLRKPQLQAAEAQQASAEASYTSAKLDLQRTRISAPYDGFTISKRVDLGQYVTIGSVLGEVFAAEGIEVSLPLTQSSYAQLDLSKKPAVTLQATFAGVTHSWSAHISRADRIFDTTTRQINVVATVKNTTSDQGLELKIGQFVDAIIAGRIAKDVFVVPNSSIREGRYVFLFDNGQLIRRDVDTIWQDQENSIINNIAANEKVVLTSLGGTVSGTKANVIGDTVNRQNTQGESDD